MKKFTVLLLFLLSLMVIPFVLGYSTNETIRFYGDLAYGKPVTKPFGIGDDGTLASFRTIINHPSGYVEKDVKLRGTLSKEVFLMFSYEGQEAYKALSGGIDAYRYFIEDRDGYRIYLVRPLPSESEEAYNFGSDYVATGQITKVGTLIALQVSNLDRI